LCFAAPGPAGIDADSEFEVIGAEEEATAQARTARATARLEALVSGVTPGPAFSVSTARRAHRRV